MDSHEKADITTLELDKENRAPRSMTVASAKKNGGSGERDGGKTPSQHTPGRRGRTGNQYFEVGKVGR